MVEKVINERRSTERSGTPSHEGHIPSYSNVMTEDTERSGKSPRVRRIRSYLKDFDVK